MQIENISWISLDINWLQGYDTTTYVVYIICEHTKQIISSLSVILQMLIINLCTVCFFMDAAASVKLDNKSNFNKKTDLLQWSSLLLFCLDLLLVKKLVTCQYHLLK